MWEVLTPDFLPTQRTFPSVSAAHASNMLDIVVTLLVFMSGTDVSAVQPRNMLDMLATLLVFMSGTDVSATQRENMLDMLVT